MNKVDAECVRPRIMQDGGQRYSEQTLEGENLQDLTLSSIAKTISL
jgi:hypothetical protein